MKKLTKDQLESKIKHHKKRVKFYKKKLEERESEENRIGFKFY